MALTPGHRNFFFQLRYQRALEVARGSLLEDSPFKPRTRDDTTHHDSALRFESDGC